MNKKVFDQLFIQESLKAESWEALSEDSCFAWSESLLEKYKDQVDWERISSNRGILWTDSMLDKFKFRVNWKKLSQTNNEILFSVRRLKKYIDFWDWSEISDYCYIEWTIELVDEFKERIDWNVFINSRHQKSVFSMAFVEQFYEHIPLSRIKDSQLWNSLVEESAKELTHKLLAE